MFKNNKVSAQIFEPFHTDSVRQFEVSGTEITDFEVADDFKVFTPLPIECDGVQEINAEALIDISYANAPMPVEIGEYDFVEFKSPLPIIEELIGERGVPSLLKVTDGDKTLAVVSSIVKFLREAKITFGREESGALYRYDTDDGFFHRLDETGPFTATLSHFLANHLPENLRGHALKKNIIEMVWKYLLLDDKTAITLDKIDASRFICFRNGVFDLKTMRLLPHAPEYGCKIAVQADYVVNDIAPASQQFFEHLGGDAAGYNALFQVLGVALSNIRNLQLSAFLIGPPASGKSEFLRLLGAMLPESAATHLSVEDLGDKFGAGNLAGAHVSICGDLEEGRMGRKALARFKKVIGADKILLQKKFVQHFSAKVTAFMIFAGNALPQVSDLSGAFERRVWLVNTGATVPPEKRDLKTGAKLLSDVDAIASKAVKAAAKIYCGGTIIRAALESAYDGFNRPNIEMLIKRWVEQNVAEDANGHFAVAQAFDEVSRCVDLQGLQLNAFGKILRKLLPGARFGKKENLSAVIGFKIKPKDSDITDCESSYNYWE